MTKLLKPIDLSEKYLRGAIIASALLAVGACGGGGGGGSGPTTPPPAAVPVATLSNTALTFSGVAVGATSNPQAITLSNTGNASLAVSSIVLSGANPADFVETNTCSAALPPGSQCQINVTFAPVTVSSFAANVSIASNGSSQPLSIALSGTASPAQAAQSVDCSVAGGACPTITFQGDPIASGGFHGYADPSIRKDPNSSMIYVAYSWAHEMPDGTQDVDLHLSASADGGATFNYGGSIVTNSTTQSAYQGANYYTSTETVDLLPIPMGDETLWVEAHQQYLVTPNTALYTNLYTTEVVSVGATLLTSPAASNAPALLAAALASAPHAALGTSSTTAARGQTQNLAALAGATAKCAVLGQQALTYTPAASGIGTLYLGLECQEDTGNGNIDQHEISHFLFSTTPSGADASTWVWAYVGEFATPAQAQALGTKENAAYDFFTEPQFVQTASGLAVVITPGSYAPSGDTQPVIQYGCRVIPIVSLSTPALQLDANGIPVVIDTVTENDLYTGDNEGPAACTYDPASATGIMMGRKYEHDPTLGFIITQVSSGLKP